ncbi:MAG: hypothetical protein KDB47_16870 [Mycobacterium sp.]|nr:hypothetical protein [Mycobacterium sp.]
MRPALIGIPLVLAGLGAGTGSGAAAQADTGEPVLHDVTYTVYTDTPFFADIYYRDTDPPSYADYSHNPYEFSPKAEADLGPDRPWVLTVKLADPQFWAMVVATSGRSPEPPNFHCTLAVDGTVLVSESGPKGALCSLRHW